MNDTNHANRSVILAAVAFIALLGCSMMSNTQVFAVWLLPIPLIVLTVFRIRWAVLAMGILATALFTVIGYGYFSILFGIALYFMGWAMGDVLRRRSVHMAWVYGTLTVLMLELVQLAMYRWSGHNLMNDLKMALSDTIANSPTLNTPDIRSQLPDMLSEIQLLVPSFLGISAVVIAGFNLLGTRLLLAPSEYVRGLLSRYAIPTSIVPVFALSLIGVLMHGSYVSPYWWAVSANAALLSGFFIALQGMALVWRFMSRARRGHFFFGIILCLSALIPYMLMLYTFGGFIDILNRARSKR